MAQGYYGFWGGSDLLTGLLVGSALSDVDGVGHADPVDSSDGRLFVDFDPFG